ncbi:MAG: InlB B-repeat-containing protein [Clostridia bacterium]|nr:InlB B-repeat-containing protein [Clostridia bacterium]
MAISTYKVFLMHSADNGASYSKLIDIKDFPDLGGDPEQLETTTLSDKMNTYIPGIQSLDGLEFTANYTASEFARIKAMEEDEYGSKIDHYFAVWFGGVGEGAGLTPNGNDGKFKFRGKLSVYPTGGGVNEVVDLKISISPSTPIEFEQGGAAGTTYTITYSANGGTGTVASQIAGAGNVVALSSGGGLTAPSDKVFAGWATSSGAASADYEGGESYTVGEDTTLYAVWANA